MDGSIIVTSGAADIGTGLDTIIAKVTSDILCIPMDKITVLSGDTDSGAFDTGSYASSGTFFSGNAAVVAATNLKNKILDEAAYQLGEEMDDMELAWPGEVHSKKTGKVLSYYEIIHTSTSGTGRGHLIAPGSFTTAALCSARTAP